MIPCWLTENTSDSLHIVQWALYPTVSPSASTTCLLHSARRPCSACSPGSGSTSTQAHLTCFPSFRGRISVLLNIQCLKTAVSYIVSRFLVVRGGRASPFPVHPSWGACPGRNLHVEQNYFILVSQVGLLLPNELFLNIARIPEHFFSKNLHILSANFKTMHCLKPSLSSDPLSLLAWPTPI